MVQACDAKRSLHPIVFDCSWLKHLKYRPLRSEELPSGISSGNTFTSVCLNTALYLPWLVSQCLANGVIFKRAIVNHISHAKNLAQGDSTAAIIVNCTGLSVRNLGGVMDDKVVPVRGQTVLVRNEAVNMVDVLGIELGSDEVTYIMQRAAGKDLIAGLDSKCSHLPL